MCLLWLTSSISINFSGFSHFIVYIFIYFYGQIIPLYGYTMIYYISFIHLSVDGYWGRFYLLAYEHCHSEHSCIRFVWTYVSVSLGYILKVKLPDHVIFLRLLSWRSARLFHSGRTILHSTGSVYGFLFLHILYQHLSSVFLIIAIPSVFVKWSYFWLLELLICNREHLNSSILIQ